MMPLLLCVAAAFAAAAAVAAAAGVVHDETSWTKRGWDEHKVEPGLWAMMNPSDEADAAAPAALLAALKRSSLNSLDGPTPRRTPTASLL